MPGIGPEDVVAEVEGLGVPPILFKSADLTHEDVRTYAEPLEGVDPILAHTLVAGVEIYDPVIAPRRGQDHAGVGRRDGRDRRLWGSHPVCHAG